MKRAIALLAILSPASAADVFTDSAGGAKVHEPSGFVCPLKIGEFERDAVGQYDPETRTDYCAYSALDGVYGSIMLRPMPKAYDPKAMLDADFTVQEGAGGRILNEWIQPIGPKGAPLSVYLRSYETAHLENQHYCTLFASAAVGAWAVQVTIEYADPKDKDLEQAFLSAAYDSAAREVGAPAAKPVSEVTGVKRTGLSHGR